MYKSLSTLLNDTLDKPCLTQSINLENFELSTWEPTAGRLASVTAGSTENYCLFLSHLYLLRCQ